MDHSKKKPEKKAGPAQVEYKEWYRTKSAKSKNNRNAPESHYLKVLDEKGPIGDYPILDKTDNEAMLARTASPNAKKEQLLKSQIVSSTHQSKLNCKDAIFRSINTPTRHSNGKHFETPSGNSQDLSDIQFPKKLLEDKLNLALEEVHLARRLLQVKPPNVPLSDEASVIRRMTALEALNSDKELCIQKLCHQIESLTASLRGLSSFQPVLYN
jgi:hypothetical protein